MGTLMNRLFPALCLLFVLAPAQAAEPTGETMAATCAGCHGTEGRLGTGEFMPLAGMKEAEFIRAMQDFRSGKRLSTLMGHVANGFTDREVRAMAQYFARIQAGAR